MSREIQPATGDGIPSQMIAKICEARYAKCRRFCPRGIYPYWREIWLERVSGESVVNRGKIERQALLEANLGVKSSTGSH